MVHGKMEPPNFHFKRIEKMVFKPGVQAWFSYLALGKPNASLHFPTPLYMLAACFWPSSMKLLELRFKAGEFILESRMYLT